MTDLKSDPAKIQQFDVQSRAKGYQASEAKPRTAAEKLRWHPPFIFEGEGFRLVTEPNVKAVNVLTKYGKESGLFPELLDRILVLRIKKSDLREGVPSYSWRALPPSSDTISYEEWAATMPKTKYRRSPSSSTLVAVTDANASA